MARTLVQILAELEADPYSFCEVSLIQDLVSHYNQRVDNADAINKGYDYVINEPVRGTDIQSRAFWYKMQNGAESIITKYVASYWFPSGFNGEKKIYMYNDLKDGGNPSVPTDYYFIHYASAGLGYWFRQWARATSYDPSVNDWTDFNDPMWILPGAKCAVGQILGPWIPWEIAAALLPMECTKKSYAAPIDLEIYERQGQAFNANCDTARTNATTAFNADSWSTDTSANFYQARVNMSGSYTATARREKTESAAYGTMPSNSASTTSVYYFMDSSRTFDDIDSLGAVEDRLYLHEILASVTADTRTVSGLDPSDTSPITLAPYTCSTDYEIEATDMYLLNKWEFDGTWDWPGESSSTSSSSSEDESSSSSSDGDTSSSSSESAGI